MRGVRAVSLPIQVLIILIISLIVLALTLFFFQLATGKHIFPAIMEKIKIALGLWEAAQPELPG